MDGDWNYKRCKSATDTPLAVRNLHGLPVDQWRAQGGRGWRPKRGKHRVVGLQQYNSSESQLHSVSPVAWVGLPAAARCCQRWENVATAKWKDFLPHSIIFMDNSFLTIKLNNNNKTGAQTNIDHRGNLWQAWESQHMNITKKTQLRRLSRLSSHEACSQIKVGVKWRSPKVLVCASLFIEWKIHVKWCKRARGLQIAIGPRWWRNGPFNRDNGQPGAPLPPPPA